MNTIRSRFLYKRSIRTIYLIRGGKDTHATTIEIKFKFRFLLWFYQRKQFSELLVSNEMTYIIQFFLSESPYFFSLGWLMQADLVSQSQTNTSSNYYPVYFCSKNKERRLEAASYKIMYLYHLIVYKQRSLGITTYYANNTLWSIVPNIKCFLKLAFVVKWNNLINMEYIYEYYVITHIIQAGSERLKK